MLTSGLYIRDLSSLRLDVLLTSIKQYLYDVKRLPVKCLKTNFNYLVTLPNKSVVKKDHVHDPIGWCKKKYKKCRNWQRNKSLKYQPMYKHSKVKSTK